MRDLVIAAAGPGGISDTRESLIARAARKAGTSFRTMKAIFYGEITDHEHKAVRRLMTAAEQNGRAEATKLATQFETIAAGLRAGDQDFHSADIAALIEAARTLRGLDRATDHTDS